MNPLITMLGSDITQAVKIGFTVFTLKAKPTVVSTICQSQMSLVGLNFIISQEASNKMNEIQFNLLASRLIKSPEQRKAIKLHALDGLSAYEAENRIHGRVTANVSRDAKRINELYEFAKNVMQAV